MIKLDNWVCDGPFDRVCVCVVVLVSLYGLAEEDESRPTESYRSAQKQKSCLELETYINENIH